VGGGKPRHDIHTDGMAKLLQKCGFEPITFDTSRKLHIPFTSRTLPLNIYGSRHMGEHICVATRRI